MNGRINRPGGVAQLTLARRAPRRPHPGQGNPLDELNEHYLRDIGFRRDCSIAPGRYDWWI